MRALSGWVLALIAFQGSADEQYQYVVGLAEKGLHDRVAKEAESFLRDNPSHPKADLARYRMACALFELKREKDALPHFQSLAARRGFEFEAEVQFRLGQCALATDDLATAEKALARAASSSKDYLKVPATWLLAESRMRAKDYDRAEEGYAAVVAAAPKGEYALDARCGIAWCAYQKRDLDRARAEIQRILADGGSNDPKGRAQEMQFLLGECELDAKRPKAAVQAYRAVTDGPFADAALRGTGFALAALGDHASAAQAFHRVGEKFPESRFRAECALQEAVELLAAKDANGALAVLESGRAGDGAQVLYWKARAQSDSGAKDAAVATLDRAIASKPDKELAERLHTARGDLLVELGRAREAEQSYRRANNDYALQAAAVASLADGRTQDAVRAAAELVDRFPESRYRADALLTLGEALFAEKRYDDAEEAFGAALSAELDAARASRARARLAWCRYLDGDARAAAERFRDLARETGDAPEIEEAGFMAARALEKAGDALGARSAYDAYLRRHARGAHAVEATLALARMEDEPRASQRLETLVASAPPGKLATEARYELAERLSKSKKYDAAAARYHEVLADPQSDLASAARYGLAFVQYQQGAHAECAETLAPMLSTPPTDERLRLASRELALWAACKMGEPELVLAHWKAFAKECKDEERLLRATRTALGKLGGPEERAAALKSLDDVARRSGSSKLASMLGIERVHAAIEAKDTSLAERELARVAKGDADPDQLSEARFALGESYFAANDDKKAIACYDAALENPSSPQRDLALYKAGFARLRVGDPKGAEQNFRALIENHAKSALFHESMFLLGESLFRAERYEECVEWLERVRKEAPRHAVMPKVLFRLGLADVQLERWRPAAEVLASLAKSYPQFENLAEAELARGRALAALGDPRAARAAFARVLELDKGVLSARAHIELGKLQLAAGAHDEALSEFLKVAVLYATPEEVAEALYLAGQTLEAQGEPARAAAQYREIVEQHEASRFARMAEKRLADLAKR